VLLSSASFEGVVDLSSDVDVGAGPGEVEVLADCSEILSEFMDGGDDIALFVC
jgi:hypothetical protein